MRQRRRTEEKKEEQKDNLSEAENNYVNINKRQNLHPDTTGYTRGKHKVEKPKTIIHNTTHLCYYFYPPNASKLSIS